MPPEFNSATKIGPGAEFDRENLISKMTQNFEFSTATATKLNWCV